MTTVRELIEALETYPGDAVLNAGSLFTGGGELLYRADGDTYWRQIWETGTDPKPYSANRA